MRKSKTLLWKIICRLDYTMSVSIDKNICRGCGVCIESCPAGAIKMERTIVVDPEKCTECSRCMNACPFGAITLQNNSPADRPHSHSESAQIFLPNSTRIKVQKPLQPDKSYNDSLNDLRAQKENLERRLEEVQKRIDRLKHCLK